MKALSVRAPWWWFILHGGKDIENRDWPTKFRGTVYLHVGKWWNDDEVADAAEDAQIMYQKANDHGIGLVEGWESLREFGGCLVGKVDIVDCVTESDSPWFVGDYGFVLANPVAFDR